VWSDGSFVDVLFGVAHSNPANPSLAVQARDGSRVDIAQASVSPLMISGATPSMDAIPSMLDRAGGPVVFAPEGNGIGVYQLTFDSNGVSSARTQSCEDPRIMFSRIGVVDSTSGDGYLLGDYVWKVSR
jgi:hypothetical protein